MFGHLAITSHTTGSRLVLQVVATKEPRGRRLSSV